MKTYSFRTPAFNKQISKLSPELQHQARVAFSHWAVGDGLAQSKRTNRDSSAISVRISESVRAVGMQIPTDDGIAVVWFFAGSHSEYEKMLDSRAFTQNLTKIREKIPHYQQRMSAQEGLVTPQKLARLHQKP